MPIDALLPEITELIIRKITDNTTDSFIEWWRRTSLVHVCRKWRALALPHICRQLIIKCSDRASLFGNVYDYVASGSNRSKVTIESNIRFISWHKDRCKPRSIKIGIYFCFNAISVLDMLCSEFEHCVQIVGSARELELAIFAGPQQPYFSVYDDNDNGNIDDAQQDENNVIAVAARFASLVPQIDTVNVVRVTGNTFYMYFTDELLSHYASQLVNINGRPEALYSTPELSDRLQCLHIDCYFKPSVQLPRVHANSLRRLKLDAVSAGFDWQSFAPVISSPAPYSIEPEAADIEFKSLEYLYFGASFLPQINTNGSEVWQITALSTTRGNGKILKKQKLLMPSLKYMRTFASPTSCSLLMSVAFPERLGRFKLGIMEMAEIELTNVHLNSLAIQKVFSRYASVPGSMYNSGNGNGEQDQGDHDSIVVDIITFTNEILCIPDLAEASFLYLGNAQENYLDMDRLEWTYLTSLAVEMTIDLSSLLYIIQRLPRLVNLAATNVCKVAAVVRVESRLIGDSVHQQPVHQLSNSLQRLSLDNERMRWSNELSDEMRRYLTARINTLVFLSC